MKFFVYALFSVLLIPILMIIRHTVKDFHERYEARFSALFKIAGALGLALLTTLMVILISLQGNEVNFRVLFYLIPLLTMICLYGQYAFRTLKLINRTIEVRTVFGMPRLFEIDRIAAIEEMKGHGAPSTAIVMKDGRLLFINHYMSGGRGLAEEIRRLAGKPLPPEEKEEKKSYHFIDHTHWPLK